MKNVMIACALLLVVAGCSDEASKPQITEEPIEEALIAQLLKDFRQAYIDMDYVEYEKLLDEAYIFVFDPDDVGPQTQFMEEWPRGDDLASTQRMFSGQPSTGEHVVHSISLDFVASEPDSSPINPDWRRVILTAVELTAESKDQHGDLWYFTTPGNYRVDLHLVPVPNRDGTHTWKIVLFEDRPPRTIGARPATEQMTWGRLKALYH